MKRAIGIWKKASDKKSNVAELVIDGNKIEFYSRDYTVFPEEFIGSDGEHRYKVVTNGIADNGIHKSLEMSVSYRVAYVLLQNSEFPKERNIEGINECSFSIPELEEWLDCNTLDINFTSNKKVYVEEIDLPSIVLNETSPRISIDYNSESIKSLFDIEEAKTTFVVKNKPKVCIKYQESVTLEVVLQDIRYIMQFWGLMIGHVSVVENIRLELEGKKCYCQLFLNDDYSYNMKAIDFRFRPRTKLETEGNRINFYFSNWYMFCKDEKFNTIRRMYFRYNNMKTYYAEDILVEYVRVLEGYYDRVYFDGEMKERIKCAFKKVEKEIRGRLFTEEGTPVFNDVLKEVIPEWKLNSDHKREISSWIANGFMGKIRISDKIREIDNHCLNILAKNANYIFRLTRDRQNEISSEEVINQVYEMIGITRNYFSHYKDDKTGVFEYSQMNCVIRVLKAIFIMVFYSHMGIATDEIKRIMIGDTELHVETCCLAHEDYDECSF